MPKGHTITPPARNDFYIDIPRDIIEQAANYLSLGGSPVSLSELENAINRMMRELRSRGWSIRPYKRLKRR